MTRYPAGSIRGLPRIAIGGEGDALVGLRELQYVLLKHPVAAQAAFAALVAEGRRYAQTPEGQRLRDRVAGSDLLRKSRVVWEVATLKMLEEDPPGVLPSTYIDAIVSACSSAELEPLLQRLFERSSDAGSDLADTGT